MARIPRDADTAIARFDEWAARIDGHTPLASGARRRVYGRQMRSAGRRMLGTGGAILALLVATVIFSQVVGPIGLIGLFLVGLATLAILLLFSAWPGAPARVAYDEKLPTRTVVRQLDSFLVQRRAGLPAPAAMRVDAIGAQLPLLESRLAEVDPLDPLAQDARRLMGRHLPELLDRYDKVPAAYRHEPDGEGLTVDQRLVTSLDAAREALDGIAAQLAESDRRAFETQGRFIESRYKDEGGFEGGR
ncbi:MAG: hypothetical protein ACK40O_09580 [Allosphingosinicella sp.]